MKRPVLEKIYDLMFERHGPQDWWPGDTPWEICVGAVLTQNTNWGNVERAIANLKSGGWLDPARMRKLPAGVLEEAIRPSGYYRIKAQRLLNVTDWWLENADSVAKRPLEEARKSILSVNGVGPETADSILLYSFNMPTFVIDKYTKRTMSRHCGTSEDIDYEELRSVFMKNLPNDTWYFNEYHALFVANGKECCGSRGCAPECPLRNL